MRERKYRVWDNITKEMLYADFVDLCSSKANDFRVFIDKHISLRNVDVMDYVQMKDKNKKQIYSGDIINLPSYLRFNNREIRTAEVKLDGSRIYCIASNGVRYGSLHVSLSEVIGNKYEDPELLEEECLAGPECDCDDCQKENVKMD